MNTITYDSIVLGAGQGGGPLALSLAQAGQRTALVEREHVGGTCVNTGCTPTKAMIASAHVAHLTKNANKYGIHTGSVKVDFSSVQERKDQIVKTFRQSSRQNYEETKNLELLMGEGAFKSSNNAGEHLMMVLLNNGQEKHIKAPKVFINTGSHATIPQVPGIGGTVTLDETSIMELEELPEHLGILGGGYVGLEFAQMFRRFGSAVTVIEKQDQVLPMEDPDIVGELKDILEDEGIDILLSSTVRDVAKAKDAIKLRVDSPQGERSILVSHLLIAVGRDPNISALQLNKVGVKTKKSGHIQVDDQLRTNVQGIYAMGDVKGGPEFTHIAYDDFRILRDNLLYGGDASVADRMVPYTVYTDPQLGRVGLTERQAQYQNINYRVARLPMASVARAIEVGEVQGVMKVIVRAENDQLLGCAILGSQGGEIMSVLQMAMMGEVPYTTIRDSILAHPTFAESLNTLFSNISG